MNERPTPETDGAAWPVEMVHQESNYESWVRTDFARNLERQRDELSEMLESQHLANDRIRKELEAVKAQLNNTREIASKYEDRYFNAIDQRDELLAALVESLALNENWVADAEPFDLEYHSEYRAVIAQARAAIASVKGQQ